MKKHQAMVNSLRSLLALAECHNYRARQDIEQARDLVRQAQRVLIAFDEELRGLERQALLNDFEAGRLALLEQAEADPENKQGHLAQAARVAKALEILSAPLGSTA